jgi:hypothetical protein
VKKALGFSVYSCEDRTVEFEVVGKAYLAGYTKVLGDNSSDEVVYLVKPEDLKGVVLDHLDEQTLEASLVDYFQVENAYEWAGLSTEELNKVAHQPRGKVEEV